MFIDQKIEVEFREKPGNPVSFTWKGQRLEISEVLAVWQDYGVGSTPPRLANWRLRRHRNYYRVLIADGRCFEFYLDRGAKNPVWILYREVQNPLSEV